MISEIVFWFLPYVFLLLAIIDAEFLLLWSDLYAHQNFIVTTPLWFYRTGKLNGTNKLSNLEL